MVFQPVLVVVLLEVAMLEVAYIGYSAYRSYRRTWNPLMLSLAIGSVFAIGSLAAMAVVVRDAVTTSWGVMILGALSLVLGLGVVGLGFRAGLELPSAPSGSAAGEA